MLSVSSFPDGAKALIAQQNGVLDRAQAVDHGVTASRIRTRLHRGDWIRLHPGVFCSVEHEMTIAARIRAAMLWSGPHAFLSGAAAAWWWRLTDIEPAVIGDHHPAVAADRASR